MTKIHTFLALALALFAPTATAFAQNERNESLIQSEKNGWEYEVRAGVNIGGASPMPLPKEIRKINRYSPKLNGSIAGMMTKWLDCNRNIGITAGLRLEEKGMETGATVKNYGMEIIDGGQRVAGNWTGDVNTVYKSSFLTMPVQGAYRLGDSWKVRAGLYVSYRMDGEFSGFVSEGYLRSGSPVGEKVVFTDGQTAVYDFSSNLRHWLWGMQLGGSWRAFKHFTVNADLTYGFNNIFKADFHTITFAMHPIYLNVGFGYIF